MRYHLPRCISAGDFVLCMASIALCGRQTNHSVVCMQGKAREVVPKLKQDMWSILQTNWKVWIPFQFFNFNFVPVPLQVGPLSLPCPAPLHTVRPPVPTCCGGGTACREAEQAGCMRAGAGVQRDGPCMEHIHVFHEPQGGGSCTLSCAKHSAARAAC